MKTLLALLCLSVTLHAETIQIEGPLSGIVEHPECGESVALVGFLHGTIVTTSSAKDQTILYVSQIGPRGDAFAVGLDSGIRFNLVGNTKFEFASGPGFLRSFTYVNNFKIVGLYSLKADQHVELNDDGTIRSWVDKLRASCK